MGMSIGFVRRQTVSNLTYVSVTLYGHVVSLLVIFIFAIIILIYYHYIVLCICVTRPQGSRNDVRDSRGYLGRGGGRDWCNTLYTADHSTVRGIKSKDRLDYNSILGVSRVNSMPMNSCSFFL
jgi:hypothetical protein